MGYAGSRLKPPRNTLPQNSARGRFPACTKGCSHRWTWGMKTRMKAPEIAAMARFTSGPATEMRMSRAGSGVCRPMSSIRVTPPMGSRMIERTATPLRRATQRMYQLMQNHAAENNAHQRCTTHSAHRAHGHRLREPHKCQQEKERQVDANVHSEQASRGNRPASHCTFILRQFRVSSCEFRVSTQFRVCRPPSASAVGTSDPRHLRG